MFTWMMENMATIIISVILMMAAGAVAVGMVRDKKKGKSSCGCGCAGCPAGSLCAGKGSCAPHSQMEVTRSV